MPIKGASRKHEWRLGPNETFVGFPLFADSAFDGHRASAPNPFISIMYRRMASALNSGIFELGDRIRNRAAKDSKTLIVSGLPRSGTSMIARALSEASVFLGDEIDDIVHEDHEIARCLDLQDLAQLQILVRARNSRFKTWGFKKPNVHDFINPRQKPFFRNPHYIFAFRDPVAIAQRNIVSEVFDKSTSLHQAVTMQRYMVEFILKLPSPVLLVSYEKAIQAPATCAEALADFAGLEIDAAQKQRMVDSIQPNRREYLLSARRAFDGSLDSMRGDTLHGWCRQVSLTEPIGVTVYANDNRLTTVLADEYREDLALAGHGSGQHGFRVDMQEFGVGTNDVIRAFADGRSFEVPNSGKTVDELRAL